MTQEQIDLIDGANKVLAAEEANKAGDNIAYHLERFAKNLGISVSEIKVNVRIDTTWDIKVKL